MKNLNTIYASWLKVFIAAVLGAYLVELQNGTNLFSWNLEMVESLLTVGIVSLLPIIINYLNPHDTRYGNK
jgi:hypothetical protein